MAFTSLIRSMEKSINIIDGFTTGNLVIEPMGVFLQLDNGSLVPVTGTVEVKIGDSWEALTAADYNEETPEGWPLNAGLDARTIMKPF